MTPYRFGRVGMALLFPVVVILAPAYALLKGFQCAVAVLRDDLRESGRIIRYLSTGRA